MPTYDYFCPQNGQVITVSHSMRESLNTWSELCEAAGVAPGDTPLDAPVERLLSPIGFAAPKGESALRNIGFTKLVKRDDGVYENVTAGYGEKRYMNRGDNSTIPDLKGKISD